MVVQEIDGVVMASLGDSSLFGNKGRFQFVLENHNGWLQCDGMSEIFWRW